jgi:hypothetical protein
VKRAATSGMRQRSIASLAKSLKSPEQDAAKAQDYFERALGSGGKPRLSDQRSLAEFTPHLRKLSLVFSELTARFDECV